MFQFQLFRDKWVGYRCRFQVLELLLLCWRRKSVKCVLQSRKYNERCKIKNHTIYFTQSCVRLCEPHNHVKDRVSDRVSHTIVCLAVCATQIYVKSCGPHRCLDPFFVKFSLDHVLKCVSRSAILQGLLSNIHVSSI